MAIKPTVSQGRSSTPKAAGPASVDTKAKSFRYPFNKIDKGDDYLKIDIIEYVAPGLGTKGGNSFALTSSEESLSKSLKSPKASIILPIPEGISDSNQVSWGESTMNPGAAKIAEQVSGAIGAGQNPFGALLSGGQNVFNAAAGAATDATGQKALQSYFSAQAAQALLGQNVDPTALISRATGSVINQNVELLFNGVSVRTFSFSFDMIPRFQRESDEIKNIIRVFKQSMSASKGNQSATGGGLFLKSPDVFQLSYMSGGSTHPFLNSFKPCALISMNVNYTGSGTYATYADATPVHMQLSLSFQELTPIYREDYTQGKGVTGVGY